MSPNLPSVPSLPAAPNTVSAAPVMPNTLTGTPDLLQATGSKVNTVAGAIKNTANGLWPVLGTVGMLGLTFLGLKAIVLGKNPLK